MGLSDAGGSAGNILPHRYRPTDSDSNANANAISSAPACANAYTGAPDADTIANIYPCAHAHANTDAPAHSRRHGQLRL